MGGMRAGKTSPAGNGSAAFQAAGTGVTAGVEAGVLVAGSLRSMRSMNGVAIEGPELADEAGAVAGGGASAGYSRATNEGAEVGPVALGIGGGVIQAGADAVAVPKGTVATGSMT